MIQQKWHRPHTVPSFRKHFKDFSLTINLNLQKKMLRKWFDGIKLVRKTQFLVGKYSVSTYKCLALESKKWHQSVSSLANVCSWDCGSWRRSPRVKTI